MSKFTWEGSWRIGANLSIIGLVPLGVMVVCEAKLSDKWLFERFRSEDFLKNIGQRLGGAYGPVGEGPGNPTGIPDGSRGFGDLPHRIGKLVRPGGMRSSFRFWKIRKKGGDDSQ